MSEDALTRARATGNERQIRFAEKDAQDALNELRHCSAEERTLGTLGTLLMRLQREDRATRSKKKPAG